MMRTDSQDTPVCPRCRQLDAVRKVSSIVKSGVSTAGYTILAQQLTPPTEKEIEQAIRQSYPHPASRLPTWRRGLAVLAILLPFVGGLCGAIFASIVSESQAGGAVAVFVGVIFGMILSGLMYVIYAPTVPTAIRSEGKNYPRMINQKKQEVLRRWNQLYYCQRDDVIFIPYESVAVSPEQMNSYLYKFE